MAADAQTSVINPETILDFIDGTTQRRDTPEERVRQEILKSLVREYGYKKDQIEVERSVKFASSRKAVDIAIWEPGVEHTQETILVIVECKDPKTKSVLLQCLFGRLSGVFPQCGLMVFPGVVIVLG